MLELISSNSFDFVWFLVYVSVPMFIAVCLPLYFFMIKNHHLKLSSGCIKFVFMFGYFFIGLPFFLYINSELGLMWTLALLSPFSYISGLIYKNAFSRRRTLFVKKD